MPMLDASCPDIPAGWEVRIPDIDGIQVQCPIGQENEGTPGFDLDLKAALYNDGIEIDVSTVLYYKVKFDVKCKDIPGSGRVCPNIEGGRQQALYNQADLAAIIFRMDYSFELDAEVTGWATFNIPKLVHMHLVRIAVEWARRVVKLVEPVTSESSVA